MTVLSRRLTLEERTAAGDGGGGVAESWVALGALHAAVRAVSARERVEGEAQSSRVTHRITVAWAPVGDPRRPRADQRLREGERAFAILGVAEADHRNGRLTIRAEEGRAS